MEKEALITAMKNSISDVLERMFFLPLDFSDTINPVGLEKEEMVVSKLSFSGPFGGYFLFFIPKGLAMPLTADFLGKDEGDTSQDDARETAKEIINMLAGNTFCNYDDQAIFDLDIPELIIFDKVAWDDTEEDIFIVVNTLKGNLALKMVKC